MEAGQGPNWGCSAKGKKAAAQLASSQESLSSIELVMVG
jgi:hypothetical protein